MNDHEEHWHPAKAYCRLLKEQVPVEKRVLLGRDVNGKMIVVDAAPTFKCGYASDCAKQKKECLRAFRTAPQWYPDVQIDKMQDYLEEKKPDG